MIFTLSILVKTSPGLSNVISTKLHILDADDFEPSNTAKPVIPTDKWEGEDEDDEVKDAWDKSDSEEDESKESISEEVKPAQRKGKKKLADKIAEREALQEQQRAERAPLTQEEKLAQKLHVQELEEKANLQLMKDMCGKTRYVFMGPNRGVGVVGSGLIICSD